MLLIYLVFLFANAGLPPDASCEVNNVLITSSFLFLVFATKRGPPAPAIVLSVSFIACIKC